VLGPARSRKSSGVIAPNLRRWPGGLVVTSTRPEAYRWARAARAGLRRPFAVFDPAGLLRAEEAASWVPWQDAKQWDRAVSVAQALAGGLEDAGTTNSRHFSELAAEWLAPILHAAALTDAGLATVRAWVAGAETARVIAFLRSQGAQEPAGELAALHALPDSEGKSAIISTARRALRWTAREGVRRNLDPSTARLDLRRLVEEGGSLIVVSPPSQMRELAPLLSALLARLVETGQEAAFCAARQRLEIPFAFVLDEVATIAPFPDLPAHLATGGGYGMPTLAVAQDLSQLAARWGAEGAQTIWDNASCRLIMPGAVDRLTEEASCRAAGEILEHRASSTRRVDPSDALSLRTEASTESAREEWAPVVRHGELAKLPLGSALCLPAGLGPMRIELV
jgi:type IV secretory pathway TraG/TraD family ATPase VirD4